MREPLDRTADFRVKEMHWLWSPGGGKTTGLEGMIQHRMVHLPSNILVVGQKDDTATRWMETRFLPSAKRNPELQPLLPSASGQNRHKLRKATVIFNHGFYLEAGGSAESNLQEKSMPLVIFEEAWKISEHPGRIQQGKQRTHDKWNAMILFVGQAGPTHLNPDDDDTQTDLYREWMKTDRRTFSFECDKCKTVQPFKWDQMKWESDKNDLGEVNWTKTAATIRMECCNQECDRHWNDTATDRRALAESGRYVVMNPDAEDGYVGYHANALCYWRIPWLKLVKQFREANQAQSRGDLTLLQHFIQQRLAEFWTPGGYEDQADLVAGAYTIEDFEGGELIDGEEARGMAIDVQQNSIWFTIGAMTGEGKIQILRCGELLTFEQAGELVKQYKIPGRCVLVDSQYRQDFVFQTCSKNGWTAYRGTNQESFPVNIAGKIVRVPYSKPIPVQSGSGARTVCINMAVNSIKDSIADMRAGRLGELLTPENISPQFKEHLNAEVKRRVTAGRENREQDLWVRIGKRDNHMLDNLMALVGLAMIKRFLKPKESE